MKKFLIFSLFVSVLLVLGMMSAEVLAQSSSVSSGPGSPSSGGVSPMIINIGPNGRVLMRGTVDGSPTTDSLMLQSWGGTWKINVLSTTRVMSLNNVLTNFQDGDFVGVLGTIVSDGSFEIDANIVRKWGRKVDHDQDGIADDQDSDDDNDGIPDTSDRKPHDHDNDGVLDDLDNDDDNDGIEDSRDSRHGDHDNDGIRDSRDRDDDNDNIPDSSDSKPHDHDNDGKDDDEDENDDNDGEADDDEDNNSNSGSGN